MCIIETRKVKSSVRSGSLLTCHYLSPMNGRGHVAFAERVAFNSHFAVEVRYLLFPCLRLHCQHVDEQLVLFYSVSLTVPSYFVVLKH